MVFLSLIFFWQSNVFALDGIMFDGQYMRHGMLFGEFANTKNKISEKMLINGKKLYLKNCSDCHGVEGKGDGPLGKKMPTKPANLKELVKKYPRHHFFMQIKFGRGDGMPSWKDVLSDKEMWEITAYIRSLNVRK